MIEVTSRHTECTHFSTEYSRMLAVVQQYDSQKTNKHCILKRFVLH